MKQRLLWMLLACASCSHAYAGEWDVTPSLKLQGIYSDNISLSPDKDREFVTEVTPGVAIKGDGRRVKLDLGYRLQTFSYFGNHSDQNAVRQQLKGGVQTELVKDVFFLNANASYGQRLISSTGRIMGDNVNVTGNQTNLLMMGVTPILRQRFGSVAEGEIRQSFTQMTYSGTSAVSDSEITALSGYFNSLPGADGWQWNSIYTKRDINRDNGRDSLREMGNAQLSRQVSDNWHMLARVGYVNANIASSRTITNGFYSSVGMMWMPTPRLKVDASEGSRERQFGAKFVPNERFDLDARYIRREVGIDTGSRWFLDGVYKTRRSNWGLRYTERVTNLTIIELEEGPTATAGTNPGAITDAIDLRTDLTLTNEEFFRRRLNANVSLDTGKTLLSLTGYTEKRKGLLTQYRDEILGGMLSVNRKMSGRTNAILTFSAQQRQGDSSRTDIIQQQRFVLSHKLRRDVTGEVELRHFQRSSDVKGAGYQENRAIARLTMMF